MNSNLSLLDTDTTSNYLDKRRIHPNLKTKIESAPPETLCISIVTYEEIIKGLLSLLNSARKHPRNAAKLVEYFALLHSLVQDLQKFRILPYDAAAEAKFQQIPSNLRHQHSQDCHIASIALAYDCTVITRNTPLLPNPQPSH